MLRREAAGDIRLWHPRLRTDREESHHILGAHLLGPHAEEVINLFAVAIRTGLRSDDLKTIPYAYPSSSSDISYMV
ncbi:MAG: hypothetical protein ACK4Z6_08705 [Candidatus Methylomirabilales bacterium]